MLMVLKLYFAVILTNITKYVKRPKTAAPLPMQCRVSPLSLTYSTRYAAETRFLMVSTELWRFVECHGNNHHVHHHHRGFPVFTEN